MRLPRGPISSQVVLHQGNGIGRAQLGLGQGTLQQAQRHVQAQLGSFFLRRCLVKVTNRWAKATKLM